MDVIFDLTLKAEIVGVMEGSNQQSMKVLVKPVYLTLPADLSVHLGDTVLINAELSVRAVRPDIETEDNAAPARS